MKNNLWMFLQVMKRATRSVSTAERLGALGAFAARAAAALT